MSYRRRGDEKIPLSVTPPQSPSAQKRDWYFQPVSRSPGDTWTNGVKSISIKFFIGVAIVWLAVIHYFERIEVARVVNKCQWKQWEKWDETSVPHRIALIADPQIIDDYSYPGRPAFLNSVIQKITDNYLYRNHRHIQDILDPHTYIFLGDLFDGGREWGNQTWFEEYKRFNRIFPQKVNRKTINSIPGNHDIGFETINRSVVERFSQYFGELNHYTELGNHSFVFLDTISLSHPDPQIHTEPTEFLDSLGQKLNHNLPRILLSHVPLYRFPDTQTCGPLREKKTPFPLQKGKQYQTVIEYPLAQKLLSIIDPVLSMAGDDHDYCDIHQKHTVDNVEKVSREIALKACSMTGGIKHPAIQLLSLNNPESSVPQSNLNRLDVKNSHFTYKTEMCYMPSPYLSLRIYILISLVIYGYLLLKYVFPQKTNQYVTKYVPSLRCHVFKNQPDAVAFAWNSTVCTAIFVSILASYYRSF